MGCYWISPYKSCQKKGIWKVWNVRKLTFFLLSGLRPFKHALGLRRACEAQQVSQESSRFRTTHQCTLVGQRLRMPSCRKEIGGNHGEHVVNTRNMIRCSSWGQGRFQKVKVPASSSREWQGCQVSRLEGIWDTSKRMPREKEIIPREVLFGWWRRWNCTVWCQVPQTLLKTHIHLSRRKPGKLLRKAFLSF